MIESGYSDTEAQGFRARYEGGESIYRIARDEHVSYVKMRSAIAEAGGVLLSQGSWRSRRRKVLPEMSAEMVTRYLRGESKRKIALAYEVSTPTVTHHLRKAGITARR